MKKLIAISLALFLTACGGDPTVQDTEGGRETEILAEMIGTVDGCKVWRLSSTGTRRYVFFVKCPSSVDTTTTFSCGKNCVSQEVIRTERN